MQKNLNLLLLMASLSMILYSCDVDEGELAFITTSECFNKDNLEAQSKSSYSKMLLRLEELGCANPDLLTEIGKMHLASSEYQLAIEYFSKSLKLSPSSRIFLLRARANYELGANEKAINDYGLFLHSVGDLKSHYQNLAKQAPWNSIGTKSTYQSVSDGDIVEALNNSGYAAIFLEEYEIAIGFFNELSDLEDGSIVADLGLAQTYYYWECDGCKEKASAIASKIIDVPGAQELYGDVLSSILEDDAELRRSSPES